jgi:hypothetical protein
VKALQDEADQLGAGHAHLEPAGLLVLAAHARADLSKGGPVWRSQSLPRRDGQHP